MTDYDEELIHGCIDVSRRLAVPTQGVKIRPKDTYSILQGYKHVTSLGQRP
jgi:hypothetical protein